jgi:hypothetical protein
MTSRGQCRVLCAVLFLLVTFQYWHSVTYQHIMVPDKILAPEPTTNGKFDGCNPCNEQQRHGSIGTIGSIYRRSQRERHFLFQATQLTRPINEEYARRWGYGYALEVGALNC